VLNVENSIYGNMWIVTCGTALILGTNIGPNEATSST
jgi:hypothetical protein